MAQRVDASLLSLQQLDDCTAGQEGSGEQACEDDLLSIQFCTGAKIIKEDSADAAVLLACRQVEVGIAR